MPTVSKYADCKPVVRDLYIFPDTVQHRIICPDGANDAAGPPPVMIFILFNYAKSCPARVGGIAPQIQMTKKYLFSIEAVHIMRGKQERRILSCVKTKQGLIT